MSELKIYNSLHRQKEVFTSLYPGHVGMYVCGPTVSGESHLGHARPYITFDVVYRYFQYLGYKVRYVRNITDAGHFEEEGREAEDKIAKRAQLEKLEPMELVQKYTNLFHWAFKLFNCLEPSIEPTATGHIIEQIEMIKTIMEKGYAYEKNGSVYFDVKKYAESHEYGILSGRVLEDMLETSNRELEGQDEKINNVDFALWKNAPPEHIMRWPSPWGEGFPGWHIECSAMSSKYLGKQFDIHGGGMDLQFPHHECEIAQSEIAHGEMMARYWMHNNMITINGRKMGKAYNNTIKLTELFSGNHHLLERGYSPMTIRFFVLQTHYRSTLDFSNEALQAAEKGLHRLWGAFEVLQKLAYATKGEAINEELDKQVRQWCQECHEFIGDDFNTAKVLANLFELAPIINSIKGGQIKIHELSEDTFALLQKTWQIFLIDILGLQPETLNTDNSKLDGVIQLLMEMRKEAKARKDYAASDKIRQQLLAVGIQLKDEKDGSMTYSIQ
ncbi:cysteine--tRNA ligase [Chitinophaga agri]|uniref:Cysteine--tRNA ligase n=1 Tax=Chitinophaga agri TaxID=2703787 RepID=A0A6B9ZH79_9BACT|nr:cysteine--tRNA ligase [Chitinophaga agri]QHS61772.1 cysteine--tRNA ligase [Chitinophaga agri]